MAVNMVAPTDASEICFAKMTGNTAVFFKCDGIYSPQSAGFVCLRESVSHNTI